MAEISIFEDEAFSVEALLAVINEDHVVYGQLPCATTAPPSPPNGTPPTGE
ncbi:hypothetical protein [Pseudomonas sp. D(2018)]|uniref:hypothetical protein n=1 Tax=Pseudomonas sp. D(2018) TaxID=2502238 RepID=UPI001484DCA7|nr:hypothetical protein [Pseudomonas sp. D(2018)]